MKIQIIGYSGCGKSTLASLLAKKNSAPVLYLDRAHFLPGWRTRPANEREKIVLDFLNENDSWVIDGNYQKVLYERRLEEADEIIFMNFNRFSCFCRAYRRYRTYKGKTRESMTDGCEEKFDLAFMRWILRESRTKQQKEKFKKVLAQYGSKTTVIRNQKELSSYIRAKHLQ